VDASAITLQVICGPVAEMYAGCPIYIYQLFTDFRKIKYDKLFLEVLPVPRQHFLALWQN
jgi:hypothetical protein